MSDSKTITVEELGSSLHECADELRGYVDKGDYKDYILPLVFYAGVDRLFEDEQRAFVAEEDDLSADSLADLEEYEREFAREYAEEQMPWGIHVPADHRWQTLRDEAGTEKSAAKRIDDAIQALHETNPSFDGISENEYQNVSSFQGEEGNSVLSAVIEIIHREIYTADKEIPVDVMGEAFMYLVKKFAEAEAGEYFTPPKLVELMVDILDPYETASHIHDPTAGSGGMLVGASNQIRSRFENGYYGDIDTDWQTFVNRSFAFSGQELNPDITSIAKMNLALHGVDGDIRRGNSLTNPRFTDSDTELQSFDYILANFPFSERGWKTETKDRAETYGDMDWSESLPHGNYGDFAFIMHMMSHLDADGKLATVIPHGVLFRNGDQDYREYLIDNDYVESVIGLPENLFEGTGIPSGILVLNKNKPAERQGEVQFINCNQEGEFYEDTGSDRFVLTDDGLERTEQLYNNWKSVERTSRVVGTDEIRENEYNMNIALYVDTTEPQDDIDVRDTLANVRDIEHEYQQLNQQFTQYMQQLNYEQQTEEDNNRGDTE